MEQFNLKNIGPKFILHHHLGLGDNIVCNGLVNYLSTRYDKIYIPAKQNLYKSIQYMYSENDKVDIFQIENETREEEIQNFSKQNNLNIMRLGFDRVQKRPFNLAFYKQIRIPYRYSFKYFSLPRDDDKELNLKEHLIAHYGVDPNNYSLVHNEFHWPGGTFDLKNVDKDNAIYVTRETDLYKNLFLYKKLIQDATEIHCINSSFIHLAERINTNAKLYYHHLRKNRMHLTNRWTYVDYED